MTEVGQLRERVTFQQKALVDNGNPGGGDRTGAWGGDVVRWARVVARTRGEVALEARLQGLQPIEVTVLRTAETLAIANGWRVLWEGRPYNVKATAPDESHKFLVIAAEFDGTSGGG